MTQDEFNEEIIKILHELCYNYSNRDTFRLLSSIQELDQQLPVEKSKVEPIKSK